jgi:poly(A) polymerase
MVDPRIVPREEHPISRRDIDPDALKVLYRLQAVRIHRVLVGGSVATCCSAATRKTSTSAPPRTPYQVKKLFRNCWIIGRRFRSRT